MVATSPPSPPLMCSQVCSSVSAPLASMPCTPNYHAAVNAPSCGAQLPPPNSWANELTTVSHQPPLLTPLDCLTALTPCAYIPLLCSRSMLFYFLLSPLLTCRQVRIHMPASSTPVVHRKVSSNPPCPWCFTHTCTQTMAMDLWWFVTSDLPGPAWPESQENGLAFRASGLKIREPRPPSMASESFGLSWPAKCGFFGFWPASHSSYIKPALSRLDIMAVVTRN